MWKIGMTILVAHGSGFFDFFWFFEMIREMLQL